LINKSIVTEEIKNKVASSPLITINLEDFLPKGERVIYDLKDNLYEGIILREKEFRTFLKENDWSVYEGKHVAVSCSVDAIIPNWAFMLLTTKIAPFASTVVYGNLEALEDEIIRKAIRNLDPETYRDKKIVIKGCGEIEIPTSAFMEIVSILQPVVASIMYGEPCSTVPVFKSPK